jgi:hypothetical protein
VERQADLMGAGEILLDQDREGRGL